MAKAEAEAEADLTLDIGPRPGGPLDPAALSDLTDRIVAQEPAALNELRRLKDGALAGDEAALRDFLAIYRANRSIVREVSDSLLEMPRQLLLKKLFGQTDAMQSMLHGMLAEEVRQLADRLAGPNPSEVERLLADRASLCWLDCHITDMADMRGDMAAPSVSRHWSRRRDAAHHRYLSSLKALAAVRRVSLLAVQVNVGEVP